MPQRITIALEILFGFITYLSTLMIDSSIVIDVLTGVLTYASARLFYHYFGFRIKKIIDKSKVYFIGVKVRIKKRLK